MEIVEPRSIHGTDGAEGKRWANRTHKTLQNDIHQLFFPSTIDYTAMKFALPYASGLFPLRMGMPSLVLGGTARQSFYDAPAHRNRHYLHLHHFFFASSILERFNLQLRQRHTHL